MDISLNCTICNDIKDLKRMDEFFFKQEDNILTLTDALMDCFNIQFLDKISNKHNMICKKCVDKLYYCCAFRKDVEAAHKRLYSALETDDKANISKISETPIKIVYKPQEFFNSHVSKSYNFVEGFIQFGEGIKTADDGHHHCKYDEVQNLNENFSDSDCSVKTDEILRATGYWKELETIKSKPQSIIPVLDDNAVTCPLCSKQFNLREKLVNHFKQHCENELCDVCGKTYSSQTYLYQHLLIHKGVTHKCTECDKTFPSVRHMKAHKKRIHQDILTCFCHICKEGFQDHSARRKHLVIKHNAKKGGEKNHCLSCDYTCLNVSDFRKHLKRSHFDTWHMKCVECSLVFLKPIEERRHLVTHTNVRDHKCEICGKKFNRRSVLTEHMKLHSNIKSFICNECNKAFSQRPAILGHLKTHYKRR